MIHTITVFCGSSVGRKEIFKRQTLNLADFLVSRKITLVYGGANVGLMQILADAMLKKNGSVTGVMPKHLVDREVAHTGLTEMHIVNSMQERKALMAELSDAFMALPGGFGTFDEIFEMCSWNQLKLIEKPIGLLNVDGFFDPLIRQLDMAVEERFLRREHRDLLLVDHDPEVLFSKLENYQPVEAEKWIDRLKEGRI